MLHTINRYLVCLVAVVIAAGALLPGARADADEADARALLETMAA